MTGKRVLCFHGLGFCRKLNWTKELWPFSRTRWNESITIQPQPETGKIWGISMQDHTGKGYSNEGSLKSWTPAFMAFAPSDMALAPTRFVGHFGPLQCGLLLRPADASVHRKVATVRSQTGAAERSPAVGCRGDPSLNLRLSHSKIMVQVFFPYWCLNKQTLRGWPWKCFAVMEQFCMESIKYCEIRAHYW